MQHIGGAVSFIITFVAMFMLRVVGAPMFALKSASLAWHLAHCENCRAKLRARSEARRG